MNINNIKYGFLKIITTILIVTVFNFIMTIPVYAQTVIPTNWQTNSVGMKTSSNIYKKTSGLTIGVTLANQSSWPFLNLQGGVAEGWGKLKGPIGIDLGEIKVSNVSASSNSEMSNWSMDEININSGLFKLTASRLHPAVLSWSSSNQLRMFSGNLKKYTFSGTVVTNAAAGPSYPKYIAYSVNGSIQIRQLSSTILNLPSLDKNWILVWYGNNSHFVDTKKPLTYSHGMYPYPGSDITVPMNQAYVADAPILLTFQNNPASISHSSEGGINLNFTNSSGFVSILPIFGREHLKASDTDIWGSSQTLPSNVLGKLNFWNQRLCHFPINVNETYDYNAISDTASITDNFTFAQVCDVNSTKFATIAPILAIAKDTFGSLLTFSANVINSNTPTEFGPVLGIDNISSYTWSLRGLKKYTDAKRVFGNGAIPIELISEITQYVNKLTSVGHLTPWVLADALPNSDQFGRIYFNNPADVIYNLSETAQILPEPQKTNLTNYIKQERATYPPDIVFNIPLNSGISRDFYSRHPTLSVNGATSLTDLWTRLRPDQFLKRIPLYNFLGLSRYYELTGETVSSTTVSAAKTALNNDMAEQDWATFSWFSGFDQKRTAVENINRHFAGIVGVTNLFRNVGDGSSQNLSRVLLAKAAVARIAMAVYPKYLYSNNIEDLNGYSSNWMTSQTVGVWYGSIFNYNWTQPSDDIRQLARLNQFEATLYDHTGYGQPNDGNNTWLFDITAANLSAFIDISPELGRLLSDFAKTESLAYINKVQDLIPHWHVSFGDAVLGAEHSRNYPTDAYQILLAKSYIQGETAANLEKRLDIPWLMNGDFFYLNKAAEVVKAYRGWTWSDGNTTMPSPTPLVKPGDTDNDNDVDMDDYNNLINNFGENYISADFNQNGTVDIYDYNILIGSFGK